MTLKIYLLPNFNDYNYQINLDIYFIPTLNNLDKLLQFGTF